jgi:LPS export ABC transporter protein LptC
MRLKSLFTLLTLALIALLIWWFQLVDDRPAQLLTGEDQHFVDVYMRDLTLTAMNADGKPGYTLRAREFNHYNDRDIATLQQPVLYLEKDKSNWELSSLEGEINDAQNQIVLHNQVVMQQIAKTETGEKAAQAGVRLRTERLDIDTTRQLATTDLLTQIDYRHLSLSARGVRLDNLNGQLELLAEVRGVYAIP